MWHWRSPADYMSKRWEVRSRVVYMVPTELGLGVRDVELRHTLNWPPRWGCVLWRQFRIEKDVQHSDLVLTNDDNIEPGVLRRLAFRAGVLPGTQNDHDSVTFGEDEQR
jgi:hypothetical protein